MKPIRHRSHVRVHNRVGQQNGRQVLRVVRWRTLLSIQGGHEEVCNPPHLQRVCGIVYSRFQHAGGQVPDVHGGESGMHADGRSCRPLQRPAIRWNAKEMMIWCPPPDHDVVLDFGI